MKTILTLSDISKEFPGVKALDNVSLEVYEGEIHALMGENGAGKSTLMKILAGLYQADSGTIRLLDEEVHFHNTMDAIFHGISMVHQELMPVMKRTVAENVFLGREPVFAHTNIVNRKKMLQDTNEILNKMHLEIKASQRMKDLSVAEIQLVEIAKAISFHPRIIIMDEPTSAISERETEHLFELIRALKSKGISIIYISHKLDEIFSITDRITVLRDGMLVGTDNTNEMNEDRLITMMVGRELKEVFPGKASSKTTESILSITDYSNGTLFRNVNLTLHKGEILGLSGLMGAGRTELVESIFGLRKGGRGRIEVNGREVQIHSPVNAIRNGIALIPEDRKVTGLNLKGDVKDNLSAVTLGQFCKFGFVDRKKEAAACEEMIHRLRIKTPGQRQKTVNLSGGNQQKIVIGKWLLSRCHIVILDEPTKGVDVGAKAEIYAIIKNLAQQGKGVIMISSEMAEIIGMCDRVLIMCEGRITGEVNREELSQETIMRYASGIC